VELGSPSFAAAMGDSKGAAGCVDSLVEACAGPAIREVQESTRRAANQGFSRLRVCKWLTEKVSMAELGCRQAVLRNVCDRLLKVSADQRPRTLKAFSHFARHALKVRAYTVRPTDLLPYLDGVSVKAADTLQSRSRYPPCFPEMLEPFPERQAAAVKASWDRISLRDASVGVQMRWIESAAIVERAYAAEPVVAALCSLGILTQSSTSLDCESLLDEHYSEYFSASQCIPSRPWSEVVCRTSRTVQLPGICAGTFVGKGGVGVKTMQARLMQQAGKCRLLPLSLKLKASKRPSVLPAWSPGWVELELSWPQDNLEGEASQRAKACTDKLAASLRAHVAQLYVQQLAQNAQRREQRALVFGEAGRKFHHARLLQRASKQQARDGGAVRGLELPPYDISGKMTVGRGQLAQRRRAAQREKRQRMLRAWAVLEFGRGGRHVRGDARRLLKHVAVCRDEKAADEALRHVESCCNVGRPGLQRPEGRRSVPRRGQRSTCGRGRGERVALMLKVGATGEAW